MAVYLSKMAGTMVEPMFKVQRNTDGTLHRMRRNLLQGQLGARSTMSQRIFQENFKTTTTAL